MTYDEEQNVLRKLALMREMTITRGCTASEADVAALKIGQAVQQYPLVLSFAQASPKQKKRAAASLFDWIGDEVTLKGMTEKAVMFTTESEQYGAATFWVPKSQLRGECIYWGVDDSGPLHCTRWFAEKEGWDE